MTTTEIPQSFQDIVRAHLPYADRESLAPDDDLAALGLDSMGVVALVGQLEAAYDLELPDDILNENTFATVGSLWREVAAHVPHERA